MNISKRREFGRYSMNLAMEQERLQGWLSVANVETESVDQLEWHRRYCVLAKDERILYFYNDTESVLTGRHSPVKFTLSGGDDAQDGQCHSTAQTAKMSLLDPNYTAGSGGSSSSSNFQRGTRQSRSFREKVRSSLQKSVKKGSLAMRGEDRSTGGSVRVGRSKSFGKNDQIVNTSSTGSGMKPGSSVENLLLGGRSGDGSTYYPSLGDHGTSLDLATKGLLKITPVHQSISPRHSCFRIITESEVVYASCGSQEELDRWVAALTDCHSPNRNHVRHVDSHLSVWILEARNLQPKKNYYCEVLLNGVLYSRTCCKLMNEILFWGEPFVFEDLPTLGSVTVKICRENYNKKKKERSDTDIGKIEIAALLLQNGQVHEQWYQLTSYTPSGSKGASSIAKPTDVPTSVRIKLQYKTVSIMPLKVYDDFLQYLKTDYGTMCDVLEPVIPAKAKDDIATTLVRILQREGKAREFICDIIMSEVQAVENENLIFRGNTFATKAVDTYMKMVGVTYLRDALTPFIHTLMDEYSEEECEVDPMKLSSSASLPQNQATLTVLVARAWAEILKSYNKFPSDLQMTLNSIRQRFGPEREEACFKLISGSIFLRFFCPAILSPSLFSLCQEYPDEKMARKLTLVAKVIQNLANFARFGVKEEYMCFMNDFVEKEIKNMKQFIDTISSPLVGDHIVPWGPQRIELGREASMMHSSLSKLLNSVQLSHGGAIRIEPLTRILHDIRQASQDDASDPFTSTFEALRVMKTTISKLDTVLPPPGSSADSAHSDTSSEYTTPAQSQTTSPTREMSPPSASSHESMLKGLQALGLADDQSSSLRSSTGSVAGGGSLSSLATHSNRAAAIRREKTQTLPSSSRGSAGDSSPETRRLSDSALQRLGVHKVGPEVHPSGRQSDAFTIDDTVEAAELRLENMTLLEALERVKQQSRAQQETQDSAEREIRRLQSELTRKDERMRRTEQELQMLRESRGKILRGLNTQTEIALVQLKRDFENMRRQLEAKDEIIGVQEQKIVSFVEANSTLRSGLQDLLSLPKDVSGSEEEEEGEPAYANGHHANVSAGAHSSDLYRMISLLGSGQFDQS